MQMMTCTKFVAVVQQGFDRLCILRGGNLGAPGKPHTKVLGVR